MATTSSTDAFRSSAWTALSEELDRWADCDRQATFWWRDDDVTQPSQALERLLELADGTPLALAAIPMAAGPRLAGRLAEVDSVAVIQHGYTHTNHAPTGDKKAEYGAHRPITEMVAEIALGARRLRDIFQDKATTIFVPPWNRIADDLVGLLPDAGISALSSFGPHSRDCPLPQFNVHVDIIDWRGDRGFGGDAVIDCVADNLARRRTGEIEITEATGLLTHHLNHDDGCWRFVTDLLALTAAHPATRWLSASDVLAVR